MMFCYLERKAALCNNSGTMLSGTVASVSWEMLFKKPQDMGSNPPWRKGEFRWRIVYGTLLRWTFKRFQNVVVGQTFFCAKLLNLLGDLRELFTDFRPRPLVLGRIKQPCTKKGHRNERRDNQM